MEDLFNFDIPLNSLRQTNNGISSAKKTNIKSENKRITRDAEFSSIINEVGGLPFKNEIVSIKSNGLSDTGSIFKHIIKNENIVIEEMYLATWVISRENIDIILNSIDNGKLKKLVFVCSTRMDELKKANASYLKEEFIKRKDKIHFKICNSHAKTFSVLDNFNNYYTVIGSGNWTENPRIETYLILNNKEVFLHNKEWMTELIL